MMSYFFIKERSQIVEKKAKKKKKKDKDKNKNIEERLNERPLFTQEEYAILMNSKYISKMFYFKYNLAVYNSFNFYHILSY